jgi:predicted Zn-dependent protease
LHDLGRELKAELDCKLLAVQAMTEAYDQASERLVNLMRAAHQFGAADKNPVQLVQQLAAQGVTHSQIAKSLGLAEADVARLLGEPNAGQ